MVINGDNPVFSAEKYFLFSEHSGSHQKVRNKNNNRKTGAPTVRT